MINIRFNNINIKLKKYKKQSKIDRKIININGKLKDILLSAFTYNNLFKVIVTFF